MDSVRAACPHATSGRRQMQRYGHFGTKNLDFGGFHSGRILILRGGILMSMGSFPEELSQHILVGIIFVLLLILVLLLLLLWLLLPCNILLRLLLHCYYILLHYMVILYSGYYYYYYCIVIVILWLWSTLCQSHNNNHAINNHTITITQ